MSYSRHAVNEADLGMGGDVNYKMHMQVRRMVSEGRNLRRRKRTQELVRTCLVKNFYEFYMLLDLKKSSNIHIIDDHLFISLHRRRMMS